MKKSKLALAIGLSLIMGVNSVYAAADDQTTDEKQQNTDAQSSKEAVKTKGIEVTATRVNRELLQVPLSVSVVTEDQISKSGAITIADALKDVPGISINNDGTQGIKRMGIRGENAFRTLVLVDGQKISEHKSMSGSPLLISPSQVSRIEVIKGPASVLYGSDAIGGVINIITKKPKDKPVEVDLGMSYDSSNKGLSENIGVSGKVNGFGYRLGAAQTRTGDLKTPDDGRVEYTDFSQKNLDGMLSYDFNEHFTLGVNGEYYDGDINGTTTQSIADEFYVKVPTWKRSKVNVFAELNDLNDYLARVRIDAFHQRTQKLMVNHIKTNTGVGSVNVDNNADNRLITNGITTQTEWQLGENNYLIAGAGFEHDDLAAQTSTDTKINMQMGPISINTQKSSVTNIHSAQKTAYGFLSNETLLPADFTASYGLRYTYVASDLYSTNGQTYTGEKTADSSNARTVFNAGLVWSGLEDQAFRFNFGQGFRAPLLQERYAVTTMGSTSSALYGNPNLKAETSNSYELGWRYSGDSFSADIAGFYSVADNYISTKEISDTVSMYYNVDKSTSFGIETELSYKFDMGVTPYTSFTYMRRRNEFNEGVVRKTYDSNTPKFSSRTGLRYTHDFDVFTLNLDGYARAQSARDEVSNTSGEKSHHGGFTTANFEVSGSFGDKRQYVVSAAWLNMLDKQYYLTDALAEAGSHVVLTFNAKF